MQYTAIFHGCKNDNLFLNFFYILAQNIDCGHTLEPLQEAFLATTHNLCFRAEIRKIYPCKFQFYYIEGVGCKEVFITRHVCMMCCFLVPLIYDYIHYTINKYM